MAYADRKHRKRVPTRAPRQVTAAGESPIAGRLLQVAFRIHNAPAQFLANALRQLRSLAQQIPPSAPGAQASLRTSIASTRTALEAVREAIRLLQSADPAAPGPALLDRLRTAIEELRPLTAAEFSLAVDSVGRLPQALEDGLAVLACEALANAARHAAAQRIAVRVRTARRAVVLEIEDDGKGIRRARATIHCGLGLGLMRAQVRLLAGRLTVQRRPSGGTLVKATVPVPRRAGPGARRVSAAGRA